jgi:DNA repair and recombination protein RAD52
MSYFGTLSYTPKEESFLKEVLNKDLGPEFLSERSGPGNTKLKYVEGWKLVNIANEVLGFNGWSNRIISQTVDYIDQANGKYSVGVSSIVRITLKDGSYHEDVGYGSMENSSKKAAALDKAKKESVTDAIKRALKHFGNVLGNSTNSKDYLKTMQKMGKQKVILDLQSLFH